MGEGATIGEVYVGWLDMGHMLCVGAQLQEWKGSCVRRVADAGSGRGQDGRWSSILLAEIWVGFEGDEVIHGRWLKGLSL